MFLSRWGLRIDFRTNICNTSSIKFIFFLFNFLLSGVSSVSWGSWTYPFLWRLNHRFYKTPKRFRKKEHFWQIVSFQMKTGFWPLPIVVLARLFFLFQNYLTCKALFAMVNIEPKANNSNLKTEEFCISHLSNFSAIFQSSISKRQIPATMHVVAGGIKLNNFENEEETRFLFWQY